jgi:hypothetical protein
MVASVALVFQKNLNEFHLIENTQIQGLVATTSD